jgi:hypothetical protein
MRRRTGGPKAVLASAFRVVIAAWTRCCSSQHPRASEASLAPAIGKGPWRASPRQTLSLPYPATVSPHQFECLCLEPVL